jgi:hypothetical protein
MAFSVEPDYLGIKDSGDERLSNMTVGITIDCDTKALTVGATDENEQPIEDARTYLFYTDYTYQALPNPGTTDANGIAVMEIPGNIRFLTALFILRVDHTNFQSKEIEFAYHKCFEPPPQPPEPEPEEEIPPEEPPANVTEPPNVTENVTTPPDVTPPEEIPLPPEESTEEAEAPVCPLGVLLLTLLFFKIKR